MKRQATKFDGQWSLSSENERAARASIRTAEGFFAARKGHADIDAAIRFLRRPGGETPRAGDELLS